MVWSMLGCGAPTERNGAPASQLEASSTATATAKSPDVVDVVCSASGTSISTAVVEARADGVHVRVRSTSGASGVYLNFGYDPIPGRRGGGGGDGGVKVRSSERVLRIAPGRARLNCSSDLGRKQDASVSIEVRDLARAWRSGALVASGCVPPEYVQSRWSWEGRPGRGPTAEAALKDLIAQTKQPTTWQAAQEGYVAAAQQGYVLRRAGVAWATADVTRLSARDYEAGLDMPCHDATRSLRTG
jgi:hypothetical protein